MKQVKGDEDLAVASELTEGFDRAKRRRLDFMGPSSQPSLMSALSPYDVAVRLVAWLGGSQPGRRRSKGIATWICLESAREGSTAGMRTGVEGEASRTEVSYRRTGA